MKAVRVYETGGLEQLRYEDTPQPRPGRGEVLIRVAAAGVNFRDIYFRSGMVPVDLPLTLGLEGAGTVEALGPEVSGLAVGDRVGWIMGLGAYAESCVVAAERVVAVPDDVALDVAAAVLAQGLTAHYLSHDTFPLEPHHTCLVHSGAGGVGLLLIQIAKLRGARVLTTVSTEEKAALAREAGADAVILYTREDFAAAVQGYTDGTGVDVVYDAVGKDTWEGSLNSLRRRGMMVLYGQASGHVPPFEVYQLSDRGSLFLTRPHLIHHIHTREELDSRTAAVFDLVRSGRLSVRIGATYPLAEAARAQDDMASRRSTGKLLLLP